MSRIGSGAQPVNSRPHFEKWNLATPTAGLRLFESIGSVTALCLIGSVGSQFSPTYGALLGCTLACITSTSLLMMLAFNLHKTTKSVDWILWETVYAGSAAFLFMVNTITMSYSSLRWTHTAWYLSAVICLLVAGAFVLDTFFCVRVLLRNPSARHSQDCDDM